MRRSHPIAKLRRLVVLAGVAVSLAACANPFEEHMPTLSEILDGGWLGGESTASAAGAAPVYCYGTIGRADCYGEPVPAEERRLVGYEGPPPPGHDDL